MKRIAFIAGGVVVVLIAGLFIVLSTIDVNQYKDVIEEQAVAATGRALSIESDMDISVSLTPAIVINGVRFQNADWGSRPDMAVIERIEASVPLLPLIFGNISATRLALISPDILLERNAQGQANWEFESEETTEEAESGASALAISAIEIDEANLVFKHAQGGSDIAVALDRLRVTISGGMTAPNIDSLSLNNLTATIAGADDAAPTEIFVSSLNLDGSSGGTDVSLGSVVSGQSIGAEGSVGAISSLAAMTETFPIALALELGDFKFDTDLFVDFSGDRPNITGSITSDTIDLTASPSAEEEPLPEKLFPSDPIAMGVLTADDANVDIAIDRIVLQEALAVTNAKIALKLENGRFSLSQTAELAGGTLSSDVSFTAPSGTVSIRAKADGISAETVAKDLDATDIITQGNIDF